MSTKSVYSRIVLKSQKLINEGIVILDASKKNHPIIFINQGFKKITGLKSSEIVGKSFKFFHHDQSTAANLKKFQSSLELKKNTTVDLYIKKETNRLCFCRISVSFIKDDSNSIGYFLLIVRDITEIRKGLINELRLEVVRSTLRSVNDIVYNYMQGLQLFRIDCETVCNLPKHKFEIFDSQYSYTLKRLQKINEMREYRESKIGGAGSTLMILSPE